MAKSFKGAAEGLTPAARAVDKILMKENNENMIRVNLRFPRELREDLEKIAKKKGVSFSSYVRLVLTEKVEEELGGSDN